MEARSDILLNGYLHGADLVYEKVRYLVMRLDNSAYAYPKREVSHIFYSILIRDITVAVRSRVGLLHSAIASHMAAITRD